MSLLEQQIKELQIKKNKADLFRLILENIQTMPDDPKFSEVSEEVKNEVTTFLSDSIKAIEDGTPAPSKIPLPSNAAFTEAQMEILRTVADRAQERSVVPTTPKANTGAFASDDEDITQPARRQNPPPQQKKTVHHDKIRFGLANRHLDGKRVKVFTERGEVGGNVVGLDAPHIIVKTDTGHTVPVLLDNIVVEN